MRQRRIYQVLIVVLLLSGIGQKAHSQGRFAGYFDSDSFWTSITVLDSATAIAHNADTIVALISNRVFDYGQLKFAREASDQNGRLGYFLAFVKEGRWYLKAYEHLSELLDQQEKGKSLVVYTEGYGKNFPAGLFRAFAMQAQYKVNVLYLDYPSINSQKKRLGNWRFVLQEAYKAGMDFAPVFYSLYHYQLQEHRFSSVNLFYHSMGNFALKRMLQDDLFIVFNNQVWVDNLILNAACVPAKNYIQWLNKAGFAQHILIHYNPEDRTLRGAQLVSGNRKIGVHPGKEVPPNTVCVNFNGFAGNGHNYFLNLPYRIPMDKQVADYMRRVLHGEVINTRDTLVFRRLHGEGHYELVE